MPIIYNGSDRPPVQLFYMIFLYIYIQKKCIEEDIIMSIKSCIAFEPQLKRDMKRLAIDRGKTLSGLLMEMCRKYLKEETTKVITKS
jgi:hypothetical protein